MYTIALCNYGEATVACTVSNHSLTPTNIAVTLWLTRVDDNDQ